MDLPTRRLSRPVWHQGRPRNDLLAFTDPATYPGRYHRTGEPGCWYSSLSERGAWAELLRHWGQEEVSPLEVIRRVGRARVEDLVVLDLTETAIREQLGVSEEELTSDAYDRCQALAEQSRLAGLDGVLAPSAALGGEFTLVVFGHAMSKVVAEHSRVQRPPVRMLDVLLQVRLPAVVAKPMRRLYEAIVSTARRLGRR